MQDARISEQQHDDFITIAEAGHWATVFLGKQVSASNISYLIQYGRINKFINNGIVTVSKSELLNYYKAYSKKTQDVWQKKTGDAVNWELSFSQYKESETTKHVHRLHPYKGKFIPQLVEYFLDEHTDNFKREVFFTKGNIILDPFCGSGTTLVQANELAMHAIGIDVSEFNTMMSNVKISNFDSELLKTELEKITTHLNDFVARSKILEFENVLNEQLSLFNKKYFPSPEFKIMVRQHTINEKQYAAEKIKEFLPIYENLIKKFGIQIKQNTAKTFLDIWYMQNIRNEIDMVFNMLEKIPHTEIKNIARIILSRTMRSCRSTTHSDLATIYEPVTAPYYCTKHGKICKPLFSISKWWNTYSKDTIKRLLEFAKIKTNTYQCCITGDSATIDLPRAVKQINSNFYTLLIKNKINGIFSSPPYVGLIDYHEQHAYAYDLFQFPRHDDLEIGPLSKGQGMTAREKYIQGISAVLINTKKYLVDNYNVFLVANDKYNLYPTIAENAGMKIVNEYHRPVLNRTEKDKGAYSETIFHLKEK
ncbi:MAG: DNA methyltransferase [Treponemataceae bacterium]